MSNNYDDIDYCLNILFDYVYNKTTCYTLNNKQIITLSDIKKHKNFDFKHIFKAEFKFMHFHNNKIAYKRISETSYPATIDIGFYDKKFNNLDDLTRPELINIAMLYKSSYILLDNINHIILPIMFFDIDGKTLKKMLPDIEQNINKYLNDKLENDSNLYILITEHYFKLQTLKEYIIENIDNMTLLHWKILFFQILITLEYLHDQHSNFKHNNLNLDAIILYIKKKEDTFKTYILGKNKFKIQNIGFDIKIRDFENSTTLDHVKNKVTTDFKDNPYYDIYYFFTNLNNFLQTEYKDKQLNEVYNFIKEIIPYDINKNEENIENIENNMINPQYLLNKNNFFNEFKIDFYSKYNSSIDNNTINAQSLTDTISNEQEHRLLGKKININYKNKKSNQYYREMKIKGSRKIKDPKNNTDKTINSDSDIFTKAERKHILKLKNKDDEPDDIVESGAFNDSNNFDDDDDDSVEDNGANKYADLIDNKKTVKKSKKNKHKHSESGAKSYEKTDKFADLEDREKFADLVDNDKFADLTDDFDNNSESNYNNKMKKMSKFIHTEAGSESDDSNNSDKKLFKMFKKFHKNIKNNESSVNKKSHKKHNTKSSSVSDNNIDSNSDSNTKLSHLPEHMKNRIKNLPENYNDEVPEHIKQYLQLGENNLNNNMHNQHNQQNPYMPQPLSPMHQQMMSQQMPQESMLQSMNMSQIPHMNYPPMPQELMQPMGVPQVPQMNYPSIPQMNYPQMPQMNYPQMPQMNYPQTAFNQGLPVMMGGSQKIFKLVKDSNSNTDSKTFFH